MINLIIELVVYKLFDKELIENGDAPIAVKMWTTTEMLRSDRATFRIRTYVGFFLIFLVDKIDVITITLPLWTTTKRKQLKCFLFWFQIFQNNDLPTKPTTNPVRVRIKYGQ
jgi:hypothetical protein